MNEHAFVSKIHFPLPSQLSILFNHLLKNGDELRIVGGAVRDFLAKKNITDFDLACKYLPEQTSALLQKNKIKTIDSSIKYGTITAIVDGQQFQVTTLRKDTRSFGRDCEVEFVDDFYEDAKRRDFTINALSVDFAGHLYDYFGGLSDLENKIVKFIGNADERIKEDYLRILRFFRFSCYYAKDLDKEGLEACIKYKSHLKDLSSERIREEFFKILKCQNRENLLSILKVMQDTEILDLILGHRDEKRINILKNLFAIEDRLRNENELNDYFEPLMLLSVITKNAEVEFILSNAEKKYLQTISNSVARSDINNQNISKKNLLKLLLDFDQKTLTDILTIRLASQDNLENFIDDFLQMRRIIRTSVIPDFPVNGNDLIQLEVEPKNIGKALKAAKEYWWQSDFLATKQEICSFIKTQQIK
ncbi:MAG: poly polymerase family protein [Rickettsiaceae bacterium]|jgi:poly(A) polymerase|nr:poly polymerase family protein [Rickettsiaceae bacterium]